MSYGDLYRQIYRSLILEGVDPDGARVAAQDLADEQFDAE
jgi:hypothetical protein